MASSSRHVGEFLVARKVLDRDSLEQVLSQEAATGIPMGKLLVSEGLVGERDVTAAIADQLRIPFWDPATHPIAALVGGMLGDGLARRLLAIAYDIDDEHLLVAMVDPNDEAAVEELRAKTGWVIRPALACRSDIVAAVDAMYGSIEHDDDGEASARPGESARELHINELLTEMVRLGASDLHLSGGLAPCVRVDGAIRRLDDYEILNGSEIRQMIYGILSQRQREQFEEVHELDASHAVPHVGRFRLNVFLQRDQVGAVLRAIPYQITPLADLGVPPAVATFAELPRGLVLVTGPTGSGKSTTLASVLDLVNTHRAAHIMTVEDPIEFLHTHKRSVVNQREVGEDTSSFQEALRHVLRQDPDVILVGEMRDLETISTALTAAETGHLVLATLHTQDAPQSIDRIIDVFPAHQQQQIRVQLATALQGVVCQQLLRRRSGSGRVVAAEVLIATPAVRNLIREGKIFQLYSVMQGGAKYGMQTMDASLAELVNRHEITMDVAADACHDIEDVRRLVTVPD